ncbi:cytochrome P450 family monooxygenase (macronuclear) [Tetrahymena thermophila SB210]|uniref:Cytochrome P450 family monooxygenase n=1 Tax=Tetrahymena thermophila (strain SB210) TaxID=312017 RepID=Q23BY2_TETTS|nr:cytochrome P450 family monooxygenase [Tetrahymena thermophila SB210]EAR93986.2 cytochrome P450 family monooxygenase [Tetrahymena thermophila SB210]|eukprot:XP_001014231.2 cytochrome P450 family monooxygenase [Tetrahymena thermophila SB210]
MQRKEELQKDPSLFIRNFLDLYLKEIPLNENKETIIDEIIINLCALIFVGTDKIGNMTGVSLYYLSQNSKIQEEARDEVINILKSIIQSQDPQDLFKALTFEDLSQMLLVHSILKVSQRLIPPSEQFQEDMQTKIQRQVNFWLKKDIQQIHILSTVKAIQTYTKILKNLTFIDG